MSKRITNEEFIQRVKLHHGDTLTPLEEYKTQYIKIKLRCNKCGNIITKAPNKVMNAPFEGCYICSGKNHFKTKQTLQEEVDKKFPNKYLIIGEYVKARQPLKIKNLECGHEYDISPDNLLRGKGCKKCSCQYSTYMELVETILDKHKISYETEKVFKDCKDKRNLPFDYYIPSSNLCIEVDGEYHFDAHLNFPIFNASYIKTITHDDIKTKYCEDNNIELLRLPYWESDNFETIILDKLQVNTEVSRNIS